MAALSKHIFANNFFNLCKWTKKTPPACAAKKDKSLQLKKKSNFPKMRSVDFFKWLAKNEKVRAVSILWGTCATYFFQ